MTPITTFSNMPNQEPFFQINSSLQSIPFPPPPTHRDLPPGFNPFLPLGSPSSAQMAQAQAALLSRNGLLPQTHQSPENMLEKYGNMLRQLQGWVKGKKGRKLVLHPHSLGHYDNQHHWKVMSKRCGCLCNQRIAYWRSRNLSRMTSAKHVTSNIYWNGPASPLKERKRWVITNKAEL